MALVAISLVTIAVCQVILVSHPPQAPVMRRPVVPMENRMMQQGMPPFPPGMMPPGVPPGQGLPEGISARVPSPQAPASEKPAKK